MVAGEQIGAMLWWLAHFCLWNLRCVFIEYITATSTHRIITEGWGGRGDSYSRVSSARPIWFVSRFSVWLPRSIADVWESREGGEGREGREGREGWRWAGLLYRYKDSEGKGRCNRSTAVWPMQQSVECYMEIRKSWLQAAVWAPNNKNNYQLQK